MSSMLKNLKVKTIKFIFDMPLITGHYRFDLMPSFRGKSRLGDSETLWAFGSLLRRES